MMALTKHIQQFFRRQDDPNSFPYPYGVCRLRCTRFVTFDLLMVIIAWVLNLSSSALGSFNTLGPFNILGLVIASFFKAFAQCMARAARRSGIVTLKLGRYMRDTQIPTRENQNALLLGQITRQTELCLDVDSMSMSTMSQ